MLYNLSTFLVWGTGVLQEISDQLSSVISHGNPHTLTEFPPFEKPSKAVIVNLAPPAKDD